MATAIGLLNGFETAIPGQAPAQVNLSPETGGTDLQETSPGLLLTQLDTGRSQPPLLAVGMLAAPVCTSSLSLFFLLLSVPCY